MVWTIPAERVKQNKNGERTHKVPITQNRVILLDELRTAFGYFNSKYVFASTTTNKSGQGEIKPAYKSMNVWSPAMCKPIFGFDIAGDRGEAPMFKDRLLLMMPLLKLVLNY